MEGWSTSPEGKNNEMYFHQESEIVWKRRGRKSRWGVLTVLSWPAYCELQLQPGSPNTFLRSPFRQSILKLYGSPDLKFKHVQQEVQQPWLRVKCKWLESYSPHSHVESLSKFIGWIEEGTTSISVFFCTVSYCVEQFVPKSNNVILVWVLAFQGLTYKALKLYLLTGYKDLALI